MVKEYKLDKPLFTEKKSINDSCFKGCHNNYVRNFKYECIFDTKITNVTDIEILLSTISG